VPLPDDDDPLEVPFDVVVVDRFETACVEVTIAVVAFPTNEGELKAVSEADPEAEPEEVVLVMTMEPLPLALVLEVATDVIEELGALADPEAVVVAEAEPALLGQLGRKEGVTVSVPE